MPDKRDYYEVLGVSREATPDEIKKSYRRLARQHHPDVNQDDPHAEERFKELGEAYDVLSNPEKRAAYDRFGHAGMNGMGGMGGYPGGGATFGDFGDLLETFFGMGGMGQGGRPDPRGADLRYDVEVTLEDAAFGLERTIRVPHQTVCGTCHGTGSTNGTPVPCPACSGTGQRRQTSTNFFGMAFTTVAPCDRCGATGEIIPNPCTTCGGQGRVREVEDLVLKVPPGVDTGSRIRFRGKGDAGVRGAQAGDLMVVIHVREHEIFQRQGRDLYCQVELPFTTATLGGKLVIPTLDGKDTLEIPPGTQQGQTLRVRSKGMPDLHGGTRGDLHVIVTIPVPTDLSARQRELLKELATERGEDIDHKPKGVFQRVKEVVGDMVDDYREKARGDA